MWIHLLLSQLHTIRILVEYYINAITNTLLPVFIFSCSFQVTAKAVTALYDKLQVNLGVGKLPEPWQQNSSGLSIIHCMPCKSTKTNKLILDHFSNRKLPSLHLSSFNLLMKSNLPSKRRISFLEDTTMLSSVNIGKSITKPRPSLTLRTEPSDVILNIHYSEHSPAHGISRVVLTVFWGLLVHLHTGWSPQRVPR